MRPYGNGSTRDAHYKPLSGLQAWKVKEAKRRAEREKPAPLPASGLPAVPVVAKPDPSKALKLGPLAATEPRRDRNW